ncbi:Gfo/Idh/MocA family oxidoreductase [Kiritimatiellaeota bacterium B1221]|nr:Gfo/Idh/MocA family oxidoreductase [Kiritimatiellaeota bacterium B1221]
MSLVPYRCPTRMIPRDHSPLRIALAGYGAMGKIHHKAIQSLQAGGTEDYYKGDLPQQLRRIDFCGICEPDTNRWNPSSKVKFYQDWDQLLTEQNPHLAVIAAPTKFHFRLAEKSLSAGVHTLVEKPICHTPTESQFLINLADSQGCRLLAGHVERYNPVTIKLKQLIANENLCIGQYRFERTQPHPTRIPDDIITDKLIHDLDLALHLFGPVRDVGCLAYKSIEGRIMEMEIELTHLNGLQGRLFVSWLVSANADKNRQVRIYAGKEDLIYGDFVLKKLIRNHVNLPCDVPGMVTPGNNQIKDQFVDFLAYSLEPVPGIPPPLLSPAEMQESIRIIEQIRSQCYHV